MNRRGELEFSINKRTVERVCFLAVIIALGIVVVVQHGGSSGSDSGLLANISTLTEQAQQKDTQISQLQSQIDDYKKADDLKAQADAERAAAIQNVSTTGGSAAAPALSGKVTYDWVVNGGIQTPAQYNADLIKEKQTELYADQNALSSATGSDRTTLQNEIDDLQNNISDLSTGDSKVIINSVSVIIDNGQQNDVFVDYNICWTSLDCTIIKGTGTLDGPGGAKTVLPIDMKIPTILSITTDQVLQITLTQGTNVVFKDSKDYSS